MEKSESGKHEKEIVVVRMVKHGKTGDFLYTDLCWVDLDEEDRDEDGVGGVYPFEAAEPLYLADRRSTMVCNGSKIVIIGRNPDPDYCSDLYDENCVPFQKKRSLTREDFQGSHAHTKASYADLNSPSLGWKPLPSYECHDMKPAGVFFKGKLYVFGGNSISTSFGEVLDDAGWEFLPLPPDADYIINNPKRFEISSPPIADVDNNRILLHFNHISSIYAYYPDQRLWECVAAKCGGWDDTKLALLGGILFFYNPGNHFVPFRGFDLATRSRVKIKLQVNQASHVYTLSTCFDACFAINESTLCIAAYTPVWDSDNPTTTRLIFMKFRVDQIKRTTTTCEAQVTVISFHKRLTDIVGDVSQFLPTTAP